MEAGKMKRNRWESSIEIKEVVNVENLNSTKQGDTEKLEESGQTKQRRSRWSSVQEKQDSINIQQQSVQVPSQEIVQQTIVLKLQLQQINDKLMTVVKDAIELEQAPDRSPSPPPRYDSSGKRTNTREVRMREALNKEKIRIIEEMLNLNPQFQAPADFMKSKPVRRIYIPKQTNPLYNFIGLIIGPRGNTQKQMEQETGCKISIRGKGSSKEGSKGRASKNIDEDEELHVHITGDEEANVEKAVKLIEELLKPCDDTLNEHKQKQLRELALINGTLREDEYCPVCGEKGHRQFECPHRAKSFKAAGVKCSICGDLSHPTRDCPQKVNDPANDFANEGMIDNEYNSFLAELKGGVNRAYLDTGTVPVSTGAVAVPKPSSSASSSGPVYVAPIVNMLSKKPQTIIRVTTVMTGNSPPVLLQTTVPSTISPPAVPSLVPSFPVQQPPHITSSMYGTYHQQLSQYPSAGVIPSTASVAYCYPTSVLPGTATTVVGNGVADTSTIQWPLSGNGGINSYFYPVAASNNNAYYTGLTDTTSITPNQASSDVI